MALVVMLVLLCLVITYCCWGTCCKLFRKRSQRRMRNRSQTSFDSSCEASDPSRLMAVVWPSSSAALSFHHHLQQTTSNSSDLRTSRPMRYPYKSGVVELPPPPYETLFGTEMNSLPPTYSSLGLTATATDGAEDSAVVSSPMVTVVIERDVERVEPTTTSGASVVPRPVERVLRSQSVPSFIGSSKITHIAVLFHTENREA